MEADNRFARLMKAAHARPKTALALAAVIPMATAGVAFACPWGMPPGMGDTPIWQVPIAPGGSPSPTPTGDTTLVPVPGDDLQPDATPSVTPTDTPSATPTDTPEDEPPGQPDGVLPGADGEQPPEETPTPTPTPTMTISATPGGDGGDLDLPGGGNLTLTPLN